MASIEQRSRVFNMKFSSGHLKFRPHPLLFTYSVFSENMEAISKLLSLGHCPYIGMASIITVKL